MARFTLDRLAHPIVQAPLAGGPSTPALAAAVSEAGGLGFVAAGYKTPEAVEADVLSVRGATDAPFGVNVFAPGGAPAFAEGVERYAATLRAESERQGAVLGAPRFDDDRFDAKVELLTRLRPAVVSFTFAAPDPAVVAALHQAGIAVWATVTTAAEAVVAAGLPRTGVKRATAATESVAGAPGNGASGAAESALGAPRRAAAESALGAPRPAEAESALGAPRPAAGSRIDALVVQGFEAGGHRGSFDDAAPGEIGLLPLLQLVAKSAPGVPLVAAGGIASGAGVAAALAAGAQAAQLGSAFMLAPEAGTSAPHRAALATRGETAMTRAFSGRTARAIVNRFLREHDADAPRAYPEVHHLTAPLRAAARERGDADAINLWAGQAHELAEERPAGELVQRLASDARAALRAAAERAGA